MKFSSFFEQKKWMIFCEYSNWQSDEIRRDIFDRLKLSLFDIEQYRLISSNQFFSQTSDIWNKIWFSQLNSFQMDFSSNLINQIWENQFLLFSILWSNIWSSSKNLFRSMFYLEENHFLQQLLHSKIIKKKSILSSLIVNQLTNLWKISLKKCLCSHPI